jgi:sugar (pentulose or hexulose) kinase
MKTVLGLDLGTTTFKGAKLDLEEGIVTNIIRLPAPEPLANLPPTRHELSPEDVIAAVRTVLTELLRSVPEATGLLICSQMHCVVFTDHRGNPRSNVITWKDRRSTEPLSSRNPSRFRQLTERVSDNELEEIGRELRVGIPITTLDFLKQTGELPTGTFPVSLPDFVLANLCHVEPTTEPTNAAAHGLLHLDRGEWHWDLINRLGLDQLHWPRIRPTGELVGMLNLDGHELACFTPVGDQQCALVGVGLQQKELSLNISTGSQSSMLNLKRPRGQFQVRPYFGGQWLSTIVSVPAGRSLSLLVKLLTELGNHSDPWSLILQEVDRVTQTDLIVDLSFFPCFTGNSGSIMNIHEGNLTVGHLFASAFRTMAINYAHCAELLSPASEWNCIVFSGGLAARFRRLREEILKALGYPAYRICDGEEETLHGLLQLAREWSAKVR